MKLLCLERIRCVLKYFSVFNSANLVPAILISATLIGLSTPARAQSPAQSSTPSSTQSLTTTGTLRGQVTDPSGAVVPSATVAVLVSGGQPHSVTTNRSGNYEIGNLAPGKYTIPANAQGFAVFVQNDVDVAADGTIYFTDASSKFPLSAFTADLLEHQPNGRFLAYDPKTKTTRVVLNNLYFANGVAVSPDQSFVLVVETGVYRVRRLWLNGPKQGQADVFIDNLPGFPDGILSNGHDKFWLALVTPRDHVLDRLADLVLSSLGCLAKALRGLARVLRGL